MKISLYNNGIITIDSTNPIIKLTTGRNKFNCKPPLLISYVISGKHAHTLYLALNKDSIDKWFDINNKRIKLISIMECLRLLKKNNLLVI